MQASKFLRTVYLVLPLPNGEGARLAPYLLRNAMEIKKVTGPSDFDSRFLSFAVPKWKVFAPAPPEISPKRQSEHFANEHSAIIALRAEPGHPPSIDW
jgi:hypothetical protein